MCAAVVESGTWDSQSLADSFFKSWPTDSRFEKVDYLRIKPTSSISDGSAVFNISRQFGGRCIQLSDCVVEAVVRLKNADNTPIGILEMYGPVNNVLHSLFSSVRVTLNNMPVNNSPEHYAYKAYLITLLSYSTEAKFTHLQAQGWYYDSGNKFDSTLNIGLTQRNALFREGGSDSKPYHGGPVTFVGKLITDLQLCDKGLPPGIEVNIDMKFASNRFKILCPDLPVGRDAPQLEIVSLNLIVPVATLNLKIYESFSRQIKKKDVIMHYKRSEVKIFGIGKGISNWSQDHVFPHNLLPSRVVVGVVPTKAFRGNARMNPFSFRKDIREATADPEVFNETTIECIKFYLDGNELDQMTRRNTKYDCASAFFRLNYFAGFAGGPTGNGITYHDFATDSHFAIFDLSTSSQSGMDFIVPAIRLGQTSMTIEFGAALPVEATVVVFAEYPSMMQIDSFGVVKMTFLDA